VTAVTDAQTPPMLLLSDPMIGRMPFDEIADPILDLREVPQLRLDGRLADPAGAYAGLRTGTVERLLTAQEALPAGIRLLVVEGYRPLPLQQHYFDEYAQELRERFPQWPAERVRVEASKYVSPPEVGPHCTGGAVDLTLCTADGTELDLGTAVNDSPVASDNACFTAATEISATARRNRDLMVDVLAGAGLVNYPTEWWHWSFGDRYWAASTGRTQAIYGPSTGPEPRA
jgi:D-alanyl-D-alanine dipeptidase